MINTHGITSDLTTPHVSAGLGLYVGTGRRYSYGALSDAIGVDKRTIQAHAHGQCTPEVPHLLRYMAVLPDAFAGHVLGLIGISVSRDTDAETLGPSTIVVRMTARLSLLAEALEDGRIDHQERNELIREMSALTSELTAFVAGLKAGR